MTMRISHRNSRSEMCGNMGRKMFSVKETEGASRVADEQLMMADSRAPKKMT